MPLNQHAALKTILTPEPQRQLTRDMADLFDVFLLEQLTFLQPGVIRKVVSFCPSVGKRIRLIVELLECLSAWVESSDGELPFVPSSRRRKADHWVV